MPRAVLAQAPLRARALLWERAGRGGGKRLEGVTSCVKVPACDVCCVQCAACLRLVHTAPCPMEPLPVIFTMYNFDETGEITIDELTLALKSAAVGLSKLTDDLPPTESEVEAVAHDVRDCLATQSCDVSLTCPLFTSCSPSPPPIVLAHMLRQARSTCVVDVV